MEPAGGLHVAAMQAASWEGSAACAHAEEDLGQGEATIPQNVTPQGSLVRLVETSQPYMMMVKLTPRAILMTVRCEEGWQVEAGRQRTLAGASAAAGSWGSRNKQRVLA